MKSVRNSYAIVTVIVAVSLFLGGLAEWQDSGIGVGSHFALKAQNWVPVVLMCHIVGAMGVIWLGWHWLKLTRAITSIAGWLKKETVDCRLLRLRRTDCGAPRAEPVAPPSSAAQLRHRLRRRREPAEAHPPTPKAPADTLFAFIHGQLVGAKPAAARSPWLSAKAGKSKISEIDELSDAIGERVDSYSNVISELKKQVEDLQIQNQLTQRQKRNTEAIIYSIRDAVIVIDEFDKLLMANEVAGRLFNFDFKNSQHRCIDELIDTSKSEFTDFLRQSKRSKTRATRREIEFSGDGRLKTFDCITSRVHDKRGQVCEVIAVLHDITREKEISDQKDNFVSAVCHELKTPLASISAYSEMLLDGEAGDSQTRREFYSVIQRQAKRLNRLIEDVLNTSRIESGLIKVEKRPVSLAMLIEEQLQMIKSAANEKNIEVIGQKPIVFGQVYADKDMISQVIVNLLSNAVKYTTSGGSIKIKAEVDEIAGTARVSITDTGVGIPENEIEHIFDKFYRVGANKAQAKGTGLGLNLVKQIVEKVHNGRVFVNSEAGVGSTFGFELPLATAETVRR